ncbi:MAG: glycogen/starch synthase [Treponemataceae bacterium]|nr:glycogen/starch synthase [Treponemataceae bacterium]
MSVKLRKLNVWQISREYAGIAEAGGVKNVVCSLSEQLVEDENEVTLFIPLYGCTNLASIKDFDIVSDYTSYITVAGSEYKVSYGRAYCDKIKVIFIISSHFIEKMNIYTYTELEERITPSHIRGQGHIDAPLLETLFQKAVLDYAVHFSEFPDIIHCHDATTALIPVFASELPQYEELAGNTRFVVTIHNAGPAYHHEFPSLKEAVNYTDLPVKVLEKGRRGDFIEPYLLAGFYSYLTTVSPWYADELMDPENANTDGLSKLFYNKKIKITGITNGIDYEKYNPENTAISMLPFPFSPEKHIFTGKYKSRDLFMDYYSRNDHGSRMKKSIHSITSGVDQFGFIDAKPDCVYFSYHGRIVHQKGIDIWAGAIPKVLKQCPYSRFIITGQGAQELENKQIALTEQFPGKVLFLRGYEKTLARLCVAASDFIVLPSFFEPCGLEDFIASIYGTIPIAHGTGGLKKIKNGETGFLFSPNDSETLSELIVSIAQKKHENSSAFDEMMSAAAQYVHTIYSWKQVVQNEYIPLYENLIEPTEK